MHDKKIIADIFLFALLAACLYLVYLFFKPFLIVIILSGVLVSIFYGWYKKLLTWFKGRNNLAALVMVILIAIIIVLPATDFIFYLSKKSVEAFSLVTNWINTGFLEKTINEQVISRFNFVDPSVFNVRNYLISVSSKISSFLVSGASSLLRGTGQFVTYLVLMFFTIFFLFRDGDKLLQRVMYLTPLPNKYDKEIFQKFRDVSYSSIVSTFIAAIAQGIAGGIGFLIVGIPAFLPAVLMTMLALLPYVGAAILWLPAGIYLLLIGKIWQGVFLLVWGGAIVSLVDNILRPMLIKGKAQVHPLLIFFSIFGGIIAFGFWGIIIGPVVISIFFVLLHIYETEYEDVLER
ncbi:MAG: AI-2E family transporter [Patescibacteria group bacterium]|jgi:predicted PurR-regulated permease PerM